jgi:twinkle protein
MGIHLNKPLHLEEDEVAMEVMLPAFEETVGNGKFYTYDHFGSMDSDNLLGKIRYLIKGFDCKWIFLDHLSIVVSGIAGDDERRLIDNTMTKLRSLVEETGCGMVLVSHLKRVDSGHEEGGRVSLHHLRGSQAIAQLSDIVIGLERNQQAETTSNETRVRVLKNRFSGQTGQCTTLGYDHDTGRYKEDTNVFQATDNNNQPF